MNTLTEARNKLVIELAGQLFSRLISTKDGPHDAVERLVLALDDYLREVLWEHDSRNRDGGSD